MALDILKKTTLNNTQKIRILKIIAYQYTIIDYIKYDKPSQKNILEIFKYEEEVLQDLANYVKCDLLGRVVDNSVKNLYDVKKIDQFIDFAHTLQTQTKKPQNKKNRVTILVGPPCSRKSSWVKNNALHALVINKDACTEEIGKKYNKNSYDEAYDFMKKNKEIEKEVNKLNEYRENLAINSKNKDITIDNPNLTKSNRKEWIDIWGESHIIEVVVFFTSFKDLERCNKIRGKQINKSLTKNEIINKLKKFSYPLLNEGIDFIKYEF